MASCKLCDKKSGNSNVSDFMSLSSFSVKLVFAFSKKQYSLKCSQVQTDSDSSSGELLNSATEISTDSEFDQDPVLARRAAPKIFIDDTHLRKHPTRVQVSTIFEMLREEDVNSCDCGA